MNKKIHLNAYKILSRPYIATLYSLLLLYLCLQPGNSLKEPLMNDKLAHFLAFSGLSFLWFLFFQKNFLKVGVSCLIYGLLIEVAQGLLPEDFKRSAEFLDLVADGVGVLGGFAVFYVFMNVFTKPIHSSN